MLKNLDDIRAMCAGMIDAKDEAVKQMQDTDSHVHLEYSLPTKVAQLDGMKKVISTAPYNAQRAGARVMSNAKKLNITYHPRNAHPDTIARAAELEQALKWIFMAANRRGDADILTDLNITTQRYDEGCVRVIPIAWQEKEAGKKMPRAYRYGPFMITPYNPQTVFTRRSEIGLEAVVVVTEHPLHALLAEYGEEKTAELRAKVQGANTDDETRGMFDTLVRYVYWDHDIRAVWVEPGGSRFNKLSATLNTNVGIGSHITIIPPTEHKIGFIPWACRVGGSSIETLPERKRQGSLYPIVKAGQWQTQNDLDSIVRYKVVTQAGRPRIRVTGPDPANAVEVDFSQFGGQENVQQGHEVVDLAETRLDTAMQTLSDRNKIEMDQATSASQLAGGATPSGLSFQAISLLTQTAVGTLAPFKNLAEAILAEVFTLCLDWIRELGEEVMVYGQGKENRGAQITIDPLEIPEHDLYLEVELSADVPTDKQKRVNTASVARQNLGYAQQDALEDIGVTDPILMMRRSKREQLEQAVFETELFKLRAQAELEIEQQRAALTMQMQQMQMQLQQAQQQAQQPPPNAAFGPADQQGIPGVEGLAFDQNQGGQGTAPVAEATFENQTGQTRGGTAIQNPNGPI